MRVTYQLTERVAVICLASEREKVMYEGEFRDYTWRSTIPVSSDGRSEDTLQITFERIVANVSAEEYLRRSV